MNLCQKLIPIIIGVSPFVLKGNSFLKGIEALQKGQYQLSENYFSSALPRAKHNREKARIYKSLGISQYMLGKRTLAQESFTETKRLNPSSSIVPWEVKDPAIIDFPRHD